MSASHKQDSSVPIPRLEDYDVSPITGFLPTTEPLRRLPNPYYKPWEDVVENLNALLLAGQLRNIVSELPMLDHTQLETQSELRRAFLILSMMSHAYIWGKSEAVSETLPACLAVPWHNISKRIGLRPVVCHAAVCLWNWRLIDAKKGRDLSNLACQHTYSGSTDEAWFYLVTTAIEAEGSRALPLIISALEAARAGDITAAADALEQMETVLKDINGVLNRMYDHCDPYVFYWRVRPYLAGWENMADGGLPNGVIYEGVEDDDSKGTPAFRKYAGGSAAQSSLIHALDIALGVEHRPTGMKRNGPVGERASSEKGQGHASGVPSATGKPDGAHNNFILKMREYMPEPHRNFLEHLNRAATLRPFVQNVAHPLCNDRSATENDRREAKRLVEMYDACLHQIKLFRDKHVQIVTLYIVIQARRGPSVGSAHIVPPGAPAAGTHASFHHEKTVSTVTDEIIHPSKQTGGIADKFSLESLSELTSKLGGTFLSKVTTTIAETTTITADTATVGLPSVVPSPPKSNSTLVDELSPTRSQLPSVVPSPPNSNSTLVGELSPTRFQFSPTKAPESTATVGLPSITPSPPNSNATLVDELSPSSTTYHGSSFGTSHPDFPQIVKVTDNTTVTVSSDESGAIKLHTIGLAKQSEEGSVVIRGTGGTNVLPFLKQARDEVTEAKLGIS